MKIVGEYLIFNTGKRVYANNGIVGIDGDYLLSTGYDNYLETPFLENNDEGYEELTKAEALELADYMIEVWQNYKQRLLK